jgi:hypothetical protein
MTPSQRASRKRPVKGSVKDFEQVGNPFPVVVADQLAGVFNLLRR